jgi:hypothetical protein
VLLLLHFLEKASGRKFSLVGSESPSYIRVHFVKPKKVCGK